MASPAPWPSSGSVIEREHLSNALLLRQACGLKCRRSFRGNLSWVHRYELAAILKGHNGCVNTIQWSPDTLLLCSGSDDRRVNLWRYTGSKIGGALALVGSLPTMHQHNIFDAQLTRCQQKIVSCGADGCVCLTHAEEALGAFGATQQHHRRLLYEPRMGNYIASKLAFTKHSGHDDVFLVSFGDGRVRLFDLRERGYRVAIDASGVGLTGIEMHPTNDTILAVGGNDPFLRIYDLRSLSYATVDDHSSDSCSQTSVVSLHTAPTFLDRCGGLRNACMADVGISGVSWSSDGRRLLANYRGNDVVMFDMASERSQAVDFPQDLQDEHRLPTEHVHVNVSCVYEGRVNEQTCVKEVRFLCGDAAVGTGGDCGNFFIWEAATGKLLRKLPADRCVVNCIAPHPVQPLVCTSGIDAEIKVWDVGDGRAHSDETRKRTSSEDIGTSSDWGRRRREGAPNATVTEAEERIGEAELRKHRGNTLVRHERWTDALEQYHHALQDLHFLFPNSEIQRNREVLLNSCLLNCAFCHLNLQEYAACIEACSKVLESDERNVKAHFRRATALGELGEFERAFADVELALSVEPGSVEIARFRSKLQKKQHQQKKRERSLFTRLFNCSSSSHS